MFCIFSFVCIIMRIFAPFFTLNFFALFLHCFCIILYIFLITFFCICLNFPTYIFTFYIFICIANLKFLCIDFQLIFFIEFLDNIYISHFLVIFSILFCIFHLIKQIYIYFFTLNCLRFG